MDNQEDPDAKWCPSGVTCQMPNWSAQHLLLEQCPRMGVLLEQCPSGQHSSAVGVVVGMSTMIPNMCPPCVQQDDATSVSTKVGQVGQVIPKWCQTQMPSGVQVGQVSDSRVGSMKTKLVSSRSRGFKQMSGKLKKVLNFPAKTILSVMFILVE